MANKAISELPQAENVNNQDLFVLEQGGLAKKLTAETFITEQGIINALAEALDGHGGIQSVTLQSLSGRVRTYLITFSDGSATTFQVLDGSTITNIQKTSTAGLVDTYTVYMSDGTTTFFQVRNGQDGSATWDQINSKAPVITETTESSAIANFLDGADDMPVTSLVANIESVQDLNGYGSPWPAGGGTNMFDYDSAVDGYIASNGTEISPPDAGNMTSDFIPVTEGEAYAYQGYPNETGSQGAWTGFAFYSEKTMASLIGTRQTLSSYIATFTAPTGAKYVRIGSRYLSGGKASLEKGTTVSPWTPYSNICPITGWTGCNVTRTGKNLMDSAEYTGTKNGVNYEYKNGVWKLTGTASATAWLDLGSGVTHPNGYAYKITVIPIKSRRTPTDTMMIGCSFAYVAMNGAKLSNQTAVVSSAQNIRPSLKLTSGQVYDDEYQMLLEFATLATTEFDPPQAPTTVSLSWQTEAGTVYGGTLDVATGLLTVDRAMDIFDGTENWAISSSDKVRISMRSTLSNVKMATPTSISLMASNSIPLSATSETGSADDNIMTCRGTAYSSSILYIFIPPAMFTTTDALKAYLAQTPLQIVYPLASPITYQLTPQEVIKTLLGTNNVWADTGNVSVTYPADTKMFIEKLTMPTEDDLVANQAITSGKYFMVGNSLYLALANIASGAQITIGTNAQRVSLADALNTINS